MYNKDQTSNEGRKMEEVMSQNGLHEEINKTTHISNNFPSCTDLILNGKVDAPPLPSYFKKN